MKRQSILAVNKLRLTSTGVATPPQEEGESDPEQNHYYRSYLQEVHRDTEWMECRLES